MVSSYTSNSSDPKSSLATSLLSKFSISATPIVLFSFCFRTTTTTAIITIATAAIIMNNVFLEITILLFFSTLAGLMF